jgi:hypothetical protein
MSCVSDCLIATRRQVNRQGKGVRAILKALGKALVMSAGTAAVICLAAAPALAASTWTVKPGGAVTAKAGTTTINDTTAGQSLTCTSSTAKGTLKTGSGLAGKKLGTFTTLSFTGCTIAGFTLSATLKSTMSLNGVSFKSGVSQMTLSGIHGTIKVPSFSCSATIDGTGATAHNGSVTATFTNKTNTLLVLTTGSTLHIYNNTCPVIANNDSVNFTGSYKFTPKTTITSP